jgi:hypothetical protein
MIEIIYKKAANDIKAFFLMEENNIMKYVCKSETEFLDYINEQTKTVLLLVRRQTGHCPNIFENSDNF